MTVGDLRVAQTSQRREAAIRPDHGIGTDRKRFLAMARAMHPDHCAGLCEQGMHPGAHPALKRGEGGGFVAQALQPLRRCRHGRRAPGAAGAPRVAT